MRNQKTVKGRRGATQPPKRKRQKVTRCPTTNKLSFPSKLAALDALSRFARRAAVQRAYDCEFCEGWHLTSQEPRS